MLKRRDWLHTKGADGKHGGDSSSDDESESLLSDRGDEVDENEGSEEIYVGRPQERSEEAESDESEGPTADDVIKAWTSEDPAANSFKGIPLRCIPCKALILNRVTYLQHLQSKGHVKKVKSACDPKEVMQLASGSNEPQEEEETHGERLARIKSLAATAPLTEKPIDADSSDDEVKESKVEISGGKRDRKKEKRPGKRQRIELKAKGIDPSTKKKYKAKLKSAKAASS